MKLHASKVVTPEGVIDATVTVDDGRITAITPGAEPGAETIDGWLVPGFVDSHGHGAAGFDYASPDLEGVQKAIDYHRSHGSTTIFASTVTEAMDDVYDQMARLRGFIAAGELEGIHLEGPFLAPEKKGAHNEALLIDPAPELVAKLIELGGDDLKMITLAPERKHGLEAFRTFADAGVAPAFGHSNADAETAKASVDAGSNVVTHLFNAMNSIHHRIPGPVPPLLNDDRVVCELICDGTHLHAEVVRMAIDAAGVDRIALVTDAMSATGQPDGDYMLGTLGVQVRSGVARLTTEDGSPGSIAGSTLTMDRAVEFVVNEAGCTIEEASLMASTVPARLHKLTDVGTIEVGKRADFCVLDDAAATVGVMRKGEWVRKP